MVKYQLVIYMKILLCSVNSKYIHSSLAVWYLYESIRNKGSEWDAEVFEATVNQDINKTFSDIISKNPDIISFSCYIWNISYVKKLIAMIYEKNPEICIILGGPEATFDAKNLLLCSPAVRYVIRGEGEEVLPALLSGKILKGVCFKEKGDVYISDVSDNVSYVSPYGKEYFEALKGRIAYFEGSRGCPFSCSFCLSGREDMLRLFDIETIKENIIKLANSGTKTVKFVDRTFNCNLKRACEIVEFIISGYKKSIPEGVCFHFEVAADLFDERLIELLCNSPAGLFQIEAGIQSFNEKTLLECTRKTDLLKIENNLGKIIRSRKLHVHTDLIAGLPYEDLKSFENSFNRAYSLHSDMLQLGFLKFLKGSRLERESEKSEALYKNEAPYEIISNKWLSDDDIFLLKNIEDMLERIHNSGRFERTLKYLLKTSGLSPFQFFKKASEEIKTEANIPLNEFINRFYEFGSKISEPALLRDIMVCDFLSVNSSGRLPSSLYVFDKELGKFRGELKGKYGSAMLFYNKKRAVTVCYDNPPHPVTGRYKLVFKELQCEK